VFYLLDGEGGKQASSGSAHAPAMNVPSAVAKATINYCRSWDRENIADIRKETTCRSHAFVPSANMSSSQPNTTLYIKNLNDKVQKDELRQQLFALFTTYGRVIDVVALKTQKMRGQAFIVFSDLAGATAALRGCEGIVFYDKPMVRCPSHEPWSLEVVDSNK
jgi:hypothetical protein